MPDRPDRPAAPQSDPGPPAEPEPGPGPAPDPPAPPAGERTDRAFHLARVCAGFTTTISHRSAQRLARLLTPSETTPDQGPDTSHAA
jgi:hypothetical protein